jgi:hypothetical protein
VWKKQEKKHEKVKLGHFSTPKRLWKTKLERLFIACLSKKTSFAGFQKFFPQFIRAVCTANPRQI